MTDVKIVYGYNYSGAIYVDDELYTQYFLNKHLVDSEGVDVNFESDLIQIMNKYKHFSNVRMLSLTSIEREEEYMEKGTYPQTFLNIKDYVEEL